VIGQDEQHLHQREQQHNDDDRRNVPQEFPDRAADEEQRREGRDGREDRENDRNAHALRPPDGGLQRVPLVLLLGVDVLPHYDGVVDDDADGENEAEEGEQVDGHVQVLHDDERARERQEDADGGPERQPGRQEERKCENDE